MNMGFVGVCFAARAVDSSVAVDGGFGIMITLGVTAGEDDKENDREMSGVTAEEDDKENDRGMTGGITVEEDDAANGGFGVMWTFGVTAEDDDKEDD